MCYDKLTKLISASGPLHMLFSQATPVYLCLIIHILVHCYLLREFFSDHYQRSHHIIPSPYPIFFLSSQLNCFLSFLFFNIYNYLFLYLLLAMLSLCCSCRLQYLQHTGLVAPWHVGFSWTTYRTLVPCIGSIESWPLSPGIPSPLATPHHHSLLLQVPPLHLLRITPWQCNPLPLPPPPNKATISEG